VAPRFDERANGGAMIAIGERLSGAEQRERVRQHARFVGAAQNIHGVFDRWTQCGEVALPHRGIRSGDFRFRDHDRIDVPRTRECGRSAAASFVKMRAREPVPVQRVQETQLSLAAVRAIEDRADVADLVIEDLQSGQIDSAREHVRLERFRELQEVLRVTTGDRVAFTRGVELLRRELAHRIEQPIA
jgi:hypothetical protein